MTILMSLVTSVKDYVEIAHKLIESTGQLAPQSGNLSTNLFESGNNFLNIRDYNEFGAILTYLVLSIKEFVTNFFTFKWLSNLWSLPLIVPDITSAMISEISVLDSYFTNAFSFLEKGLSTTYQSNVGNLSLATDNLVALEKINQNAALFGFEKFMIGFLNSFFLFLPSSTAHLITLRRFVMQGIEAGFMAGLGTIAGNFLWLSSIILGLRFIVIPWLSLDIFRYILGFMLLVKYLWDSSKELNKTTQRNALDNNQKTQIFLLNFLLALTEQTSIYPFISNMSFGAEGSILEGFHWLGTGSENFLPFVGIHLCYLLGILLGSFSLLQFAVWFWENPAFSIYMWIISANNTKNAWSKGNGVTTSTYYKVMNFIFLYLTMLCAISSIPYFGLDYTITKPLGLIPQDRMIDQKLATVSGKSEPILQELSFLGVKPTDKNSRTKDGVHARRERWKERLIKYQAFDGSLYGQGTYDILTVEDLNYGFDRFWLRRKMRNHQIRFRLFPGPWMRSVKKQLNKPGSEGPRTEFFRILFEQYYHPSFGRKNSNFKTTTAQPLSSMSALRSAIPQSAVAVNTATNESTQNQPVVNNPSLYANATLSKVALQKGLVNQSGALAQNSALRKFSTNVASRINQSVIQNGFTADAKLLGTVVSKQDITNPKPIYSKSFQKLFSKIQREYSLNNYITFRKISKNILIPENQARLKNNLKKTFLRKKLSKKERSLLVYKTNLYNLNTINKANYAPEKTQISSLSKATTGETLSKLAANTSQLNYYLQKNDLFKLKLQYYSTAITRKFSPGNNQPYLKTLLKRAFYYHKPTLRLKRTLFTAAMRRGFRKKSAQPRKLVYKETGSLGNESIMISNTDQRLNPGFVQNNSITLDNGQYSVLGKLTSRYRYQIYKDVLQHWYYSPFNRLLLKFDVDSFMDRQPKSHFLTKKEERLLHLRRVLLYEHYNTLRWYTYMQHYLTMKSQIGGTKSFASTAYNQQFQGTFKKIRHLFYITPSQVDQFVDKSPDGKEDKTNAGLVQILKFDQPLYNLENLTKMDLQAQTNANAGLLGTKEKINSGPYKHWNLGSPYDTNLSSEKDISNVKNSPKDFVDTSLMLGGGLMLSNFKANSSLNNSLESQKSSVKAQSNLATNTALANSSQILLLDLLKQSKKFLHNQTFLKNYISHRIEKRVEQQLAVTPQNNKELKSVMLDSLKNWYNPIYSDGSSISSQMDNSNVKINNANDISITTGMRKALNDGVFILNNKNPSQQNKSFFTKENFALKFKDQKALNMLANRANINTQTEEQLKQTLNSLINITNNQKAKLTNLWSKKAKQSPTETSSKLTSSTIQSLRNVISTTLKPFLILQNKLLAKRSEKTLEWWRQKQRVTSKIKSARKKSRFKNVQSVLTQKKSAGTTSINTATLQSYLLPVESLRKKTDQNSVSSNDNSDKLEEKGFLAGLTSKTYFVRKFQKQSKGRRYRNLAMTGSRGFAYVRKPKNINSFTTSAAYLEDLNPILGSRYSAAKEIGTNLLLSKDDKTQFLKEFKQKLAKNLLTASTDNATSKSSAATTSARKLKDLLMQGSIKKSPSKKRSKRTWKKRKRQKFLKNHYKYRKRQIHGLGKLVVLAKKMRKLKAKHNMQNWWWNSYLPLKANQIRSSETATIKVDNLSFKPLSTQKALEIMSDTKSGPITSGTLKTAQTSSEKMLVNKANSVNLGNLPNNSVDNLTFQSNTLFNTTTSIPFYAGWDESLRKFVVTNRLLSRTKAGSEVNLTNIFNTSLKTDNFNNNQFTLEFNKAPIKGLNEGSFLFLQTDMPFNSYIIDQFIPNNQSFYAPLGWSNFQFKHSLLKTWLNNKETQINTSKDGDTKLGGFNPSSGTEVAVYINKKPSLSTEIGRKENQNLSFLKNRRIKKRYKLLKQTPMQLMYAPTGQLLAQTLPSHYISVFDKQYRFPRNIYIKRSLPNTKTLTASEISKGRGNTVGVGQGKDLANIKDLAVLEYALKTENTNFNTPQSTEFTLRKRIKPRRKYHKKRLYRKDFLIFPRRTKFGVLGKDSTNDNLAIKDNFRLRPSTVQASNTPNIKKTKTNSQTLGLRAQAGNAAKTNPVRLRQLRRREFSQVFKPLQRFQPRYGGFTWPGDYLRLEVIPMPKLESLGASLRTEALANSDINLSSGVEKTAPNAGLSTKAKTKINVQPVGLLPRKYFVQKHNLKVFKKKMYLNS